MTSPESALRSEIAACLEEVDELVDTFNAILRIARLSHQEKVANKARCNLYSVVANCVDLYEPLAEIERQSLIFSGVEVEIFADEQLLKQAICNVLDNAIKFSPPGEEISITLNAEKSRCRLLIVDRGAGIPEPDKEKVLQRFYRGDSARQTKGNGLGLSLVKAIADYHQAKLTLEDNRPGLRLGLEFPRAVTQTVAPKEAA
jgi:signal transduction histidine kinase